MDLKILVFGLVLGVVMGSLGIYAVTPHPEEMTRLREEIADLEDETASLNDLLDEKEDELESLYNQVSRLEAKNSELEHLIQNISSVVKEVAGVEVLFLEDKKAALEYARWICKANESIWVMVTSISIDDLGDALISASQRGVDVRVIVDESYEDRTAPREVFDKTLYWGVDIRTFEHYTWHINHRAMIVDREIVIAGSYSWGSDYPSNLRNSIFILRDGAFAQIFMEEFDDIWRRTTSLLPQPLEPWPELENGTILISELEPNPPGSDMDNEWIELYNPWNFTIDISGYKLYFGTLDTNLTLTSGTHISPHQYLVISLLGELLNEHDRVVLYNADGDMIDHIGYFLDTEDNDITCQRVGKQSWDFTYHTKGRPYR